MNNNIIEVINKISNLFPKAIFCGSVALDLQNKLEREVKDVDVLLTNSDFSLIENYFVNSSQTDESDDDYDEQIENSFTKRKKIIINNINIDFFVNENIHNNNNIIWKEFTKYSSISKIYIQEFYSVLEEKLKYLRFVNNQSFWKHYNDLNNSINKSWFQNKNITISFTYNQFNELKSNMDKFNKIKNILDINPFEVKELKNYNALNDLHN